MNLRQNLRQKKARAKKQRFAMHEDIKPQFCRGKISVIIPVYNAEKYLGQCLDSLLNQTYDDLEIICVDDGSADKSLMLLKEYALCDNRVRVLAQPNMGQGAARNYGIEEASGCYIAFLDADDWLDLTFCEKMLGKINEYAVDFVMCSATLYHQREKRFETKNGYYNLKIFYGDGVYTRLSVGMRVFDIPVMPWGKLFRSEFLKGNNIRFMPGRAFEDNGFFTEVFFAAQSFYILKERLVFYRIEREDSDTGSKREKYLDFIFQCAYKKKVLERYGLYDQYEKCWINDLLYVLESRQEQICDDLKETFYQMSRELVLSVEVSSKLWEQSPCIRENYRLYLNNAGYAWWVKAKQGEGSVFLRKKVRWNKVSYYFFGVPALKKYNNGSKKIFGIPLGLYKERKIHAGDTNCRK